MSWAYIEAANFAIRFSETIRRWYDRKAAKRHRMIALKAVAHKIARACFRCTGMCECCGRQDAGSDHCMRDGVEFDVKRAFT